MIDVGVLNNIINRDDIGFFNRMVVSRVVRKVIIVLFEILKKRLEII